MDVCLSLYMQVLCGLGSVSACVCVCEIVCLVSVFCLHARLRTFQESSRCLACVRGCVYECACEFGRVNLPFCVFIARVVPVYVLYLCLTRSRGERVLGSVPQVREREIVILPKKITRG